MNLQAHNDVESRRREACRAWVATRMGRSSDWVQEHEGTVGQQGTYIAELSAKWAREEYNRHMYPANYRMRDSTPPKQDNQIMYLGLLALIVIALIGLVAWLYTCGGMR